jgi:hypothetical protein
MTIDPGVKVSLIIPVHFLVFWTAMRVKNAPIGPRVGSKRVPKASCRFLNKYFISIFVVGVLGNILMVTFSRLAASLAASHRRGAVSNSHPALLLEQDSSVSPYNVTYNDKYGKNVLE